MIKTGFWSCLRLAKICVLYKVGIELLQNSLCILFWLDWSRIRFDRSKVGHNVFFCRFSNSALSPYDMWSSMFCPRYKRKTLATFLMWLYFAVCMNLLWDLRGDCLHTCLGWSRRRFHWELDDHSVAAQKSLKICKQEYLYLLENPRKKESVVSKLARGRVR